MSDEAHRVWQTIASLLMGVLVGIAIGYILPHQVPAWVKVVLGFAGGWKFVDLPMHFVVKKETDINL